MSRILQALFFAPFALGAFCGAFVAFTACVLLQPAPRVIYRYVSPTTCEQPIHLQHPERGEEYRAYDSLPDSLD